MSDLNGPRGAMRFLRRLAVASAALIIGIASFGSEVRGQRTALIVGAGSYTDAPPLPNPPNDARAIATALRRAGYAVTEVIDPTVNGFQPAIDRFVDEASRAEAALLYYAGHAIQVAGENYLVPIDGRISTVDDVGKTTVALNPMLERIARNALTLIVILDACRNNPFMERLGRNVAASRGLAEVNLSSLAFSQSARKGVGALIAFATAPGEFAQDGTGENSPYTAALLKYLDVPGIEIGRLFRLTRKEVILATNGTQRPWEQSSLLDDFYLIDNLVSVTQSAPTARQGPVQTPSAAPKANEPPKTDRPLGGEEIRNFLTDGEFLGVGPGAKLPFLAQIKGDGNIIVVQGYDPSSPKPETRTIRGKWRIEGDKFCRDFPKGSIMQAGIDRSSSCQVVSVTSQGLALMHPDGKLASHLAIRNIKATR